MTSSATHEVQLRWQDIDGIGHVNHVVALTYLEEGRDALLSQSGIGPDEYVVGRCSVSYFGEIDPAQKSVRVECAIRELGNSSLATSERILDGGGNALVEAEFDLVLWDSDRRGSRPITDDERASLTPVEESQT